MTLILVEASETVGIVTASIVERSSKRMLPCPGRAIFIIAVVLIIGVQLRKWIHKK